MIIKNGYVIGFWNDPVAHLLEKLLTRTICSKHKTNWYLRAVKPDRWFMK